MEEKYAVFRKILQAIPKMRVVVVGDAMLDHYIWGDVHRISPEAPIPVVAIERDTYRLGGACNVALNMKQLGASVTFVGLIGNDEAGHRIQNLLNEHAIAYAPPVANVDIQTIVKSRVIARNQQVCRLDREAPWPTDAIQAVEKQLEHVFEQGPIDLVLVSDYAKGTITQSLLDLLGEKHQEQTFFWAIDPKPNRGLRYRGADLLKPNRSEALQLSSMHATDQTSFPAQAMAKVILEQQNVRYLGITLGEQGIILVDSDMQTYWEPTVAKEVFDVSGAGDTALVGLATALCVGESPATAAQFANLLSGIVVRKIGTATTTPEEVLAFLARA